MDSEQNTLEQSSEVATKPIQTDEQSFVRGENVEPHQFEQQPDSQQRGNDHEMPAEKIVDAVDEPEDEDEDDDYDDDDDEEKENSQKLVIDLHDDEEIEEEEDDEDDKEIVEQREVVAIELTHGIDQQILEKDVLKESPVIKPPSIRLDEPESIITLSDAEEEASAVDAVAKPGKIQKRKSVGAPLVANEEERFRLKRRKINVEGAPKMPLTGYVRYMNDRRESARKEFPNKTNIEITKQIGEEWQSLPGDIKAEYLEAAEKDKKRYTSELHTFLKSRPDILASELAKNKVRKADNNGPTINSNAKLSAKEKPQATENSKFAKEVVKDKIVAKEMYPAAPSTSQNHEKPQIYEKPRRKRTPTPPSTSASSSMSTAALTAGTSTSTAAFALATNIITPTPGEIPIFTNEFLEHNKLYDIELRSLRKSKTDLEQQNFVLEKHVENMKCGVEKMVSENNEIQEKNRLLEIYLDKLKRKLAQALSSLPLPNAPNGATMENIDKYMQDLYKMSSSNSHGPATLNKAKDIIRKLDLQIQL